MKHLLLLVLASLSLSPSYAMVYEEVFVESPTDSDKDGAPDRIYVSISRPSSETKLSSIFHISPYAEGGNNGPMHDVDLDLLPQDAASFAKSMSQSSLKTLKDYVTINVESPRYAKIDAHSVGTGKSSGCATVGDKVETLAAKAVIDWLNGRARAFDRNNKEVKADWSNGNVGMTGTSYDGTLPIMVAATGVEGLKAIVPIAAISNWYDYYRANGLVVNPGGYIGEDADVLGFFIMRRGSCTSELAQITKTMGREHGDFTPFWQVRNHLADAKSIKAATFIIHGQSDWNVKQKHAIQLWEALEGVAPRRMFLHRGGHGSTSNHGVPKKLQDWFDHFLEGVENGITSGPQVEVELSDGTLITQNSWPHERTQKERFYLNGDFSLSGSASPEKNLEITDVGNTKKMDNLISNPKVASSERLVFLSEPMKATSLLSGTPQVTLNLAVMNRRAANLTVYVVEYDSAGRAKVITRGWADPQNFADITKGELLVPKQKISMTFDLEPKQARVAAGSRIGVVLASTDYDYTLRPKAGTKLEFTLGSQSFVELNLER